MAEWKLRRKGVHRLVVTPGQKWVFVKVGRAVVIDHGKRYLFITASCATLSRMEEADPKLSVLIGQDWDVNRARIAEAVVSMKAYVALKHPGWFEPGELPWKP